MTQIQQKYQHIPVGSRKSCWKHYYEILMQGRLPTFERRSGKGAELRAGFLDWPKLSINLSFYVIVGSSSLLTWP
jgi:hypothetical protein